MNGSMNLVGLMLEDQGDGDEGYVDGRNVPERTHIATEKSLRHAICTSEVPTMP